MEMILKAHHILMYFTGPSLEMEGEKYVELGQQIFLQCTAHSGTETSAHMDIDWFREGSKLTSNRIE